jgi:hypothetical protein
MRDLLVALLEVAGLVLVAAGCASAWPPLGLIAAGAGLILIARGVTS